jgi:hypothetical protein
VIDTSYRDTVVGWNRRYWLESGYSREQIRAMDPNEAAYEISFSLRAWDDVATLQSVGQYGFSYGPEAGVA